MPQCYHFITPFATFLHRCRARGLTRGITFSRKVTAVRQHRKFPELGKPGAVLLSGNKTGMPGKNILTAAKQAEKSKLFSPSGRNLQSTVFTEISEGT